MNYNKRIRIVGIISSVIITIIILAGICVYATLPWLVRGYVSAADIKLNPNSYEVMLSLLYCVGIPVMVLLGLALTLTVNISRGKAFVRQNTMCLNLISLCSLIIGIMFFVAMFFLSSIFPIIIATVFILLAILTKVFADLFRTAIQYKKENDLTI